MELPEITLRAADVVPPTVLSAAELTMSRPLSALGTAAVPAALVPMKSFATDVVVRAGVADVDAPGLVARDHVVVAGRREADEVAGGLAVDEHAVAAVAQGGVAPWRRCPMRSFSTKFSSVSKPGEADAVARVARDDVAGCPARPTKLSVAPELTATPSPALGRAFSPVDVGADVDAEDYRCRRSCCRRSGRRRRRCSR